MKKNIILCRSVHLRVEYHHDVSEIRVYLRDNKNTKQQYSKVLCCFNF